MDASLSSLIAMLHGRRRGVRRSGEVVIRPPKAPTPSASLSALRFATDAATHGATHTTTRAATHAARGCPIARMRRKTSPLYRLQLLDAVCRDRAVKHAAWASTFVPDERHVTFDHLVSRGYGGRFIDEDGTFMSSCQSGVIRMYDPSRSQPPVISHEVECMSLSWTLTDFDCFQKRFVVYSSLNHLLHLVDLAKKSYNYSHEALDCSLNNRRHHVYSVLFSADGRHLVCGSGHRQSNGGIIVYNVPQARVVTNMVAHEGDVNSVTYFSKGDQNLLVSGADDGLAKLWDLREMRGSGTSSPVHRPVATFAGHRHGITHCSPRDDGRFFITTSKDQTIKLWDVRRPSPTAGAMASIRRDDHFDYRFAELPPPLSEDAHPLDSSVVTYCGSHETMQTLIRSRFSPAFTTGQMYIYTGSRDGACVVYDALTGCPVRRLTGFHTDVTRDVSWHPTLPVIATTSWDCRIAMWRPKATSDETTSARDESELSYCCRKPSRRRPESLTGPSSEEADTRDLGS
jgi:DDB1- and CUL4-associated factor 11